MSYKNFYDSSLGSSKFIGFRCGICYEYTMYNLKDRKVFPLKQRPLIVMDRALVGELGTGKKAKEEIKVLKGYCKKFNGDFVLLWHNSFFLHKR